MSKIRNTDVDKWFNTSRSTIKLKKRSIEQFKTDIKNNSRVFFSTYKKITDYDIVKEHLTKADTLVLGKPSKKRRIFNTCFLIANILLVALVFYNFAHEQGGIQPLSTLLAGHPKWRFLFVAIGLYFFTVFLNTLKYSIFIKKKTGKFKLFFSLKLATIGRYYDLITPMNTGGQAFEIYYLKKKGYSGDTATAIPMAKYMIWQISFFLLSLIILIAYSKNYISSIAVLVCAWTGLSVVLLIFLFVFFISTTKKFGASIVVGILKLLYKMRIIKNYKLALHKVLKFVKSYQYNFKLITQHPLTILSEILITMLSIISNSLIAFFIYLMFAEVPQVSWWDIVCGCIVCDLATGFIPLPGGSGAQELSFNALLGSIFPEGSLFWAVLFWRILTYYMYILQGAIYLLISSIHNKFKKSPPQIPSAPQKTENEKTV